MATLGCPCGYLGDERHKCRCSPPDIERYARRVSGPLRDRIDLTVDVQSVPPTVLSRSPEGEASAEVRRRVLAARARQAARYADSVPGTNARAPGREMSRSCALDDRGRALLDGAADRLGLSARAYDRTRRVARTIADLDGTEQIRAEHIAEALQYRLRS